MPTKVDHLCAHCGNDLETTSIKGKYGEEEKLFCCDGCRTVYEIIHNTGKSQYYSIKGSAKLKPVQIDLKLNPDLDTDLVYKKYLKPISEDRYEVFIKIQNIHCSACIWLNEKALLEAPGVVAAQINFATGTAKVQFELSKIKLRDIFEIIQSIGYKPTLFKLGDKLKVGENNLKNLLSRIAVAGFSFGNIMLFSTALYSGYFQGIESEFKKLFHFVSWALATPAYLYSGQPFLRGARAAIFKKTLTMDFLIFSGISLAYFFSVYVTISNNGEVYFDSVAMIYFFILIGKYFEERARVHSAEKIDSLLSKLPETVILINREEEKTIPSESVISGMKIKVLPGSRLPIDAKLLSERALVDESFLTGESIPIQKKSSDLIKAGAIILEEACYLEAVSSYSNSTLSGLKQKIEEAITGKPKIQVITERIAGVFIKIVFFLAVMTFLGWMYYTGNFETSLIQMIAVLIVACPCALGIAVPTALVMNHLINSSFGVVIKSPQAVEPLADLDAILFDKTGTLTAGNFGIVRDSISSSRERNFLYLIEKESNHPIARSIIKYLSESQSLIQTEGMTLERSQHIPGRGIKAEIKYGEEKFEVLVGNEKLLEENSIPLPEDDLKKGTTIYLSVNKKFLGSIVLNDTIRPESLKLIENLKSLVPDIRMVSGDRSESVIEVARSLNIQNFTSEATPEMKSEIIKEIQSQWKKVAMVGDGINDSLSLATSDVGISHNQAEDLSIDKSDIIIVSDNFMSIYKMVITAKLTKKIIYQNIFLSFLYNSIMLPLAIFGYMMPVVCAIFMTLSSLTVLINSLTMKWRLKI